MSNILDKIVADKRIELEQQKRLVPLDQLKEKSEDLPKCRNFIQAVTKDNKRGINVIAEVKKASPSAGLIRTDFDPAEIASVYESCNADAISVLTDQRYFQGKLEYLTIVKQTVCIPVMRKDFIIDAYQLYEARAAGADAILLIGDVLSTGELSDLLILANELTLSVLLEVHDADVLMQVRSLIGFPQEGYSVLGINNRNLTTMKVDINNFIRLAELADNPKGLVAESGIKTREHVELLQKSGASACLIGQTLCEHPDIAEKFRELFY